MRAAALRPRASLKRFGLVFPVRITRMGDRFTHSPDRSLRQSAGT